MTLCKNSKTLKPLIERALGVWIYEGNRKYLDAFSSYSSANFGHAHPVLFRAFVEQSQQLSVFSRTCTSVPLRRMTETINQYFAHLFDEPIQTLPMNTGVEAAETAVKIARKWGYQTKHIPMGNANVVFAVNNYWGRTISAISTSSYEYQKWFYPKTPGFITVPYNDVQSLKELFEKDTNVCAVFLEPIQGEGGVNVPSSNYFKEVKALCTKHNVLLIVDEIQTGMGRCGPALCIEDYDVKPDIVLLGKSLGGGFVPVSCVFGKESVLDLFEPGEHSSTFGGFPLGARMAYESLHLLFDSGLIQKSKSLEHRFFEELFDLKTKYNHVIKSFRGKGMLWGIQLHDGIQPWVMANELVDFGIVTREANNSVLRICPPLIIDEMELQYLFKQLRFYLESKQILTLK